MHKILVDKQLWLNTKNSDFADARWHTSSLQADQRQKERLEQNPTSIPVTKVLMKRWHEDEQIARREWKKHRRMHVEDNKDRSGYRIGVSPYIVDCECDEQVGRFHKKDAWDCGNPHCGVCHSDKYPKRSKHEQEIKAD